MILRLFHKTTAPKPSSILIPTHIATVPKQCPIGGPESRLDMERFSKESFSLIRIDRISVRLGSPCNRNGRWYGVLPIRGREWGVFDDDGSGSGCLGSSICGGGINRVAIPWYCWNGKEGYQKISKSSE